MMDKSRVNEAGNYTKPTLRKQIFERIKAGDKGGKAGQWSARKAVILAKEYEAKGGGYKDKKAKPQKDLTKWTKEDWGTKSGKPSVQGKEATGERYLPRKAREALTKEEYKATTEAKRKGAKTGKQFVPQPKKIAEKTKRYR